MKILFFGTPVFAEIVLSKLLNSKHQVVGVVCQTDKPAGRGNKMLSPHIVTLAKENGLQVFQVEKIKDSLDVFSHVDCDIFVTASYGKFLPKELLDMKMCINVHPSLLPKYRGATPIQSALLNGDNITGVTVMKTDVGMDDGDIILQTKEVIGLEDDYHTLMPRLAEIGGDLLLEALEKIDNGTVTFTKQDERNAVIVRPIKKEDGLLDFKQDATSLVNKIRAYVDFPTAYFFLGEDRIKVYKAKTRDITLNVGEIYHTKKEWLIGCGEGVLQILKCQASGGKVLDVANFLNGYHFDDKKVRL